MYEERVLIYGVGGAGKELLHELKKINIREKKKKYKVVCFLDDDKSKLCTRFEKIPVWGGLKDLVEVVETLNIDSVYIAIPSSSGNTIKKIVNECSKTKVMVKIVPRVSEIIAGQVSYDQVRDIEVEDVLGRAVVRHDLTKAKVIIQNKTVLVTGAAGSIGTELCKQLINLEPKFLICIDNRESAMFYLEQKLSKIQKTYPNVNIHYVITDIKDRDKLSRLFSKHKPNIVFNSAAYKHVPLMESNVDEAIKNNIGGAINLIEESIKNNVDKFILISSDKAVNPTNVMGATKRLTERLMAYYSKVIERSYKKTKLSAVRFGNVLNSDGSVIPTFKEQIKEGYVTITHKDIYRYFMTISEAAQLVIQTSMYSNNNEIFILDMGKPIKILDLAKSMIRLSGKRINKDVKIKYIGLRPGEKLREETLTKTEGLNTTSNNKIFILKKKDNLNNRPDVFFARVLSLIHYAKYSDHKTNDLKKLLKRLVPTYKENKQNKQNNNVGTKR